MTGDEIAKIAREFYSKTTCYLKGAWGQKLTNAEYKRLCNLYSSNTKYGNEKYVGTNVYPFDCICFVKAITSGATPDNRITYTQLKNGILGDCTNQYFYDCLYDCVYDPEEMLAGMGVASTKHAGIVLGENCWIDCNFTGTNKQDGLAIHYSNPMASGYKVGKIPKVVYEDSPVVKDDVQDFLQFLYEQWKGNKK